jgi:hypothetical protein
MTMKNNSPVILSRVDGEGSVSQVGHGSFVAPSLRSGRLRMTTAFLFLLAAFAASAQSAAPFDLEVGYRWLDLKGDEGMYRTQIDERSGLLIRAFTMTSEAPFADRVRIDISDLGVGPAGSFRLDAGRASLYRFRLGYRNADLFSAVPAFALGQHTYDRTRRTIDADLELFPDRNFVPFVGYSFNRFSGPGTTSYHLGQDEFLLGQSLSDREHEYRAGASFRYAHVYGQVTQGWRHFRGDETLSLFGPSTGNSTTPVLGRDITASTISRHDATSVDTPFTSAYVTGQFAERVKVIGNFVRFNADWNGNESEADTGSLVSFTINRFFAGLNETATSRVKNTTWRGGARAEITLADNVDVFAGFEREHRDLEGSALINDLFLQTLNFGGADPRDVTAALNANSSMERTEDVVRAGVSARAIGPFALRAEVRESDIDASVTPDLSEIVVPGAQGGSFVRRVRTFDSTGSYSTGGLNLTAAWRHDSADANIFRTDFLNRNRYRVRVQYNAPKWIRAGITAEKTKQSNDHPDVAYNATMRQYTATAEVAPLANVAVRGSISRLRADSTALFRRPETFAPDTSLQVENGRARELGVTLSYKRVAFDTGYSRFTNDGSYPFTLERTSARATIDLKAKTGLAFEWNKDRYEEAPSAGNFDANRYGIYLRWAR